MRSLSLALAISLAGLLACIEQTTSSSPGEGLNIKVAGAGIVGLDSFHVTVNGPTTKTVTASPGASVTISGLTPGSYTVILQGYKGTGSAAGVAFFGQTAGVSVVAGQTASATVNVASYQTSILSMASYTSNGQAFPLVYSNVAGANGYVVQRSTTANFASSLDTSIAATDTSVLVSVPATGPYYVRVLALDPTSARGQASAPLTVTTVTQISVTPSPITIAPGATQQFTAVAKDAQNNTVAGVSFFWFSQDATIATVDALTGLATGKSGGAVQVIAVGASIAGAAALTVSAIVPTKLAYTTQPSSILAGDAISPAIQVEVRDASNNRVTTASNQVTLTIASGPGGATLLGTKTVGAINGIASFSGITITKAGAGYTLTASASGLTPALSAPAFLVAPAAPASLAFTAQPTNTEGNVVIAPSISVTILDAYGNVVTSATNPVTIAIGSNPWKTVFGAGGTLSGTTTQAAASGAATFSDLKIDKPGNAYSLLATSGSLASATSAAFNIDLTISSLASGLLHTCAIAAAGTYCWGYNGDGELGGPTGNTFTDSVPVLVTGGLTFTQITAGYSHTCALTAAGAAYCWGYNGNGQLGTGSAGGDSTHPSPVTGGLTFTEISAGASHTCGRTTSSDIYCWGNNGNRQLGDSTTTQRPSPTKVKGVGSIWTTVSAGNYHTCGLTTGSNNAYCWGYNGTNALGYVGPDTGKAALVSGGFTYASISAATYYTCALLTTAPLTGNAKCWGYNYYGQLGNNASLPGANVTSPGDVYGSQIWQTSGDGLSAGSYYTSGHTCAVRNSDKAAYCWGYDSDGELGDGGSTNQSQPVAVSGVLQWDAIRSGGYHTCGLVGSTVYCWGYGGNGELGNGSTVNKAVPTRIVQ